MNKNKLIREQLDEKIKMFHAVEDVVLPISGWVHSIRQSLNMSMRQLSERLSITPQSVKEIEEREKKGTVSIKVLRQTASALNMKFVYGFIPHDKTLEKMIEKRAEEIAKIIVQRTSVQMGLEDQSTSQKRIDNNIEEKTKELIHNLPKLLWD